MRHALVVLAITVLVTSCASTRDQVGYNAGNPAVNDGPDYVANDAPDYQALLAEAKRECKLRLALTDSIGARIAAQIKQLDEKIKLTAAIAKDTLVAVSGASLLTAYVDDYTCFAELVGGIESSSAMLALQKVMTRFSNDVQAVSSNPKYSDNFERVLALDSLRNAFSIEINSSKAGDFLKAPVPSDVIDESLPKAPDFTVSRANASLRLSLVNAGFAWAQTLPGIITANDLNAVNQVRTHIAFYLSGKRRERDLLTRVIDRIYQAGSDHVQQ